MGKELVDFYFKSRITCPSISNFFYVFIEFLNPSYPIYSFTSTLMKRYNSTFAGEGVGVASNAYAMVSSSSPKYGRKSYVFSYILSQFHDVSSLN